MFPTKKMFNAPRIPRPIERVEHHGDSSLDELAKELIALTRLDGNTIRFCSFKPITLKFASRVGIILVYSKNLGNYVVLLFSV